MSCCAHDVDGVQGYVVHEGGLKGGGKVTGGRAGGDNTRNYTPNRETDFFVFPYHSSPNDDYPPPPSPHLEEIYMKGSKKIKRR